MTFLIKTRARPRFGIEAGHINGWLTQHPKEASGMPRGFIEFAIGWSSLNFKIAIIRSLFLETRCLPFTLVTEYWQNRMNETEGIRSHEIDKIRVRVIQR